MSKSDHQPALLPIEKVLTLLRSVQIPEGTDKDGVEHLLGMAVENLKNCLRLATSCLIKGGGDTAYTRKGEMYVTRSF